MSARKAGSRVVGWLWRYERACLAAAFALCFLAGVWGLRTANPAQGLLDWSYASVRLFFFNCDTQTYPLPLPLEVSRWVAPLLLAGGFFRLLASFFLRQWLILRRTQKLRGHTIICGLGARGSWIARNMSPHASRDGACVSVELNAGADSISELRKKDFVVIEGSARDIRHLEDAGLQAAGRVVIVAGDDQNNLSIAREIDEYFPPAAPRPSIIVGVEDYGARSFFSERLRHRRFELMGFREQAALWLARELTIEFARKSEGLPIKRPTICLEASDELRTDLIRAISMVMQTSGEERPVIVVCGTSAEDQRRFEQIFPSATLCVDLRWVTESAESFSRLTNSHPDFAVFALEQDAASLDAADRFLFRHPGIAHSRVVACLRDTGDLYNLSIDAGETGAMRSPRIISLFKLRGSQEGFIGHTMDEEGRELNEQWEMLEHKKHRDDRGRFDGKAPGRDTLSETARKAKRDVSWENLTEFKKNSNRSAALHAPVKAALREALLAKGIDDQDILHHLTVTEHMRWVAFHVMNGWQPSEVKLDAKNREATRRHHCITSFDNLTRWPEENYKQNDLTNVLFALGLPEDTKVKGINS